VIINRGRVSAAAKKGSYLLEARFFSFFNGAPCVLGFFLLYPPAFASKQQNKTKNKQTGVRGDGACLVCVCA
jgi:hypothetical protein